MLSIRISVTAVTDCCELESYNACVLACVSLCLYFHRTPCVFASNTYGVLDALFIHNVDCTYLEICIFVLFLWYNNRSVLITQ